MKRLWTVVGLLLLVFGLAAGSVLLKQKNGFDLRKKADAVTGSQLLLKGPTEIKPGEKFEVQILVDTLSDKQYTISGVDAVVSYNTSNNIIVDYPAPPAGCRYVDVQCFRAPCEKQLVCETPWNEVGEEDIRRPTPTPWVAPWNEVKESNIQNINRFQLISVLPGSLFDSYPTLNSKTGDMTCGGIAGKACPTGYVCSLDLLGRPQVNGQVYPDETGTCMLVDKEIALSGSYPQSNFSNPITISGIKNYSVDENGIFQGLRGGGVFATLTFEAPQAGEVNIRLNYNGAEATNDSNINGFSVAGPVSIQKPVERLLSQPNELKIKVASAQTDCRKMGCSGTICSDSKDDLATTCEWNESYSCYQSAKCERQINGLCGFTPTEEFNSCLTKYTSPTPTPCQFYNEATKQFYPCPSPTSFPQKYGVIKASMIFEGMQNRPLEVKLYGEEKWYDKMYRPSQPPYLLGTAKSQPDGSVIFKISSEFIGRMFEFYIETPSHLRQYQQTKDLIVIRKQEPCMGEVCTTEEKYQNVDFGFPIPGDVYTDSLGQKDQTINTFDVSTSYSQWSVGAYATFEGRAASDLNGDGAVNNRDLAILLSNFGKTTTQVLRKSPISTPRPLPAEINR